MPFQPVPLYRDLLELASQRVIVFEPTLAGIRDALRLRALHDGPSQSAPTVLVLNRDGMPGGLTLTQVEDALEGDADVDDSRHAEASGRGCEHGRARGPRRQPSFASVSRIWRGWWRSTGCWTAPQPLATAKRRSGKKRGWQIWKKA